MKASIIKYLQDSHTPVKRHDLLAYLHSIGHDCTDREMRATIEDMCINSGHPIASSERGYAIIHNVEELDNAMRYLKAKAFPLFKRADSLQKNFYKNKDKQLLIEEFFQNELDTVIPIEHQYKT